MRWEPLLLGALLLAVPSVGALAATTPSPLLTTAVGPLAATTPSPLATPAPMPNLDLEQPTGRDNGPSRPKVVPGLSRPSYGMTGDSQGYTAGSSYSDAFDGRFRVMPTLRLSVPLQ